MYYSTHLIAGATAGMLAGDAASGFVAGLVSHAFLDIVPHHDFRRIPFVITEIIVGTVLFLFFIVHGHPNAALIFGSLGGILPDAELPLYYGKITRAKYFPSHIFPHKQTGFFRGIWLQAAIALAGLYIIS